MARRKKTAEQLKAEYAKAVAREKKLKEQMRRASKAEEAKADVALLKATKAFMKVQLGTDDMSAMISQMEKWARSAAERKQKNVQ